jgi:hypothetical protein
LWLDPDVRWLTGVHEADGHLYLLRESYEELLWWLLLPSLLRVAGEAVRSRTPVEEMSKTVAEALATAESAGYRVDTLLGTVNEPEVEEEAAEGDEGEAVEAEATTDGETEPPQEEMQTRPVAGVDHDEPN